MADALDQILQNHRREEDAAIGRAQHDYNWTSTFGRVAPEEQLRKARNMTSLINNAIERKMQLAAQTNAEAQRIYINDQKFKAWQESQPLRDDLLKAQIADEKASAAARAAQELRTTWKRTQEANVIKDTEMAQLAMDQIESSTLPESEKRAQLNMVRGKYPNMSKDAALRHQSLHNVFNPKPVRPINVGGDLVNPVTGEVTYVKAPDQPKPRFTPMQEVELIDKDIAPLTSELKETMKREQELLKDNPWLRTTTGEFVDQKTNRAYFGNNLPGDRLSTGAKDMGGLPEATQETRAAFAEYQDLKSRREKAATEVSNLREKRAAVLRGDASTQPASAPTGTPAPAATPAPTPPPAQAQFSNESEARASGAKTGDIVIVINPATGKPQRARLD